MFLSYIKETFSTCYENLAERKRRTLTLIKFLQNLIQENDHRRNDSLKFGVITANPYKCVVYSYKYSNNFTQDIT